MSAPIKAAPVVVVPATIPPIRLLVWGVRRELWENRSLYIVPLLAALLVLVGFVISALRQPESALGMGNAIPMMQTTAVMLPYYVATGVIIATVVIVGWFYCLDALHGERRDRSILFWKSLPVSDRITVLSKAAIPFVVMPVIAFLTILTLHAAMLALGTMILKMKGGNLDVYWSSLTIAQMVVGVAYAMVVLPLWHAPITAWMLLVSAWAQRATFLWALLPPAAVCVAERLAMGGTHIYRLIAKRIADPFSQAFSVKVDVATEAFVKSLPPGKMKPLPNLVPDPMAYLSSADLWFGLIVAFVLIAACVQLRRRREPI